MKILVTGAAGFLGREQVEQLVERGEDVRALLQASEVIRGLEEAKNLELVRGDLRERESLRKAVRGVQCLYHLAARTGPWGPEEAYRAVNVRGLGWLIEEALTAGVERIVHTSSITVYGHHLQGVVSEESPMRAEDNPYSRSKIAGEQLIERLVRERGAPIVIVRPGWIYGPGDQASFGRFVGLLVSGRGFLIGGGQNRIPLVYVRDVVQGLQAAGSVGSSAIGRAYNLIGPEEVTQEAYLSAIASGLGVREPTRRVPYGVLYMAGWAAEQSWRLLGRRAYGAPPLTTYGVTLLGGEQRISNERARRELGYRPGFHLKQGVEESLRWYRLRQSGLVDGQAGRVHEDRAS